MPHKVGLTSCQGNHVFCVIRVSKKKKDAPPQLVPLANVCTARVFAASLRNRCNSIWNSTGKVCCPGRLRSAFTVDSPADESGCKLEPRLPATAQGKGTRWLIAPTVQSILASIIQHAKDQEGMGQQHNPQASNTDWNPVLCLEFTSKNMQVAVPVVRARVKELGTPLPI